MTIRKATKSDVPSLVSLNAPVQAMHAAAFPEKFKPAAPTEAVTQAFAATFDDPTSYWLVAETDHPVAFLKAEFRDREESWHSIPHKLCYLAGIAVAASHRRKGIARSLFTELQREATARGIPSIELDVWSFNQDAQQTFKKLGFRPMRMTLTTKP